MSWVHAHQSRGASRPDWSTPLALVLLSTAVLFPTARVGAQSPPLHERIDQAIAAAYAGPVAPPASDDEFVRRVYLDLVGRIPSVEELEAVRANSSPNRCAELIDALLKSPECDEHLAKVFDVMLMERRPDKYVTTDQWRRYLVASFAANKPFNQLAAEILTASGEPADHRGPAKFLLEREVESHAITRDVSRMFFGRDIQCAQCHDHPIVSDYLQSDYYGLLSFLNRTYRFERPVENTTPLSLVAERAEGDLSYSSVFEPEAEKVTAIPVLPDGRALDDEPIYPVDQAYQVAGDQQTPPVPRYSRREQLARRVAEGRSELFRVNIANRLWRVLMKRGLVEPPDFIHSGNPASYPLLLDELGDAIAEMDFNVKEFLRQIALSAAYRRSVTFPDSLLEEVDQAAGQLTAWQPEVEFQQQVRDRAAGAVLAAAEQLQLTRNKLLETRQAIAANLQQVAEIQQQRAQAEDKRRQGQERRTQAATLAETLQQAAEKSEAAAQQRPDDEPIRTAAGLLRQRTEAVQLELTALDKELAEHQAAIEQADRLLAERAAARATLEATLDQLADRAQEESGEFRALKLAHDLEEARLVSLRQQVEFAEQRLALRDAEQVLAERVARRDALAGEPGELTPERQQTLATAAAEAEAVRIDVQQRRERLRESLEQRFLVATIQPLSPEQIAASMIGAVNLQPRINAEAESQWQDQHKDAAADPIDPQQRQREIEALVAERRRQIEASFVSLFAATPGSPQDTFFATVDQALFMDNDGQMQSWVQPHQENLTARLQGLESGETTAQLLYRSILSREPTSQEQAAVVEDLTAEPDNRAAVVEELVWSLLTSVEFRFHH